MSKNNRTVKRLLMNKYGKGCFFEMARIAQRIEEIGGIKYKLIGAAHNKVDIFLVPSDNYEEAKKVMKEKKYKFKLVKVATLREAIDYLEGVADE